MSPLPPTGVVASLLEILAARHKLYGALQSLQYRTGSCQGANTIQLLCYGRISKRCDTGTVLSIYIEDGINSIYDICYYVGAYSRDCLHYAHIQKDKVQTLHLKLKTDLL